VLDQWDDNCLASLPTAARVIVKASRIRDGRLAAGEADGVLANLRELARDDESWSDYDLAAAPAPPPRRGPSVAKRGSQSQVS